MLPNLVQNILFISFRLQIRTSSSLGPKVTAVLVRGRRIIMSQTSNTSHNVVQTAESSSTSHNGNGSQFFSSSSNQGFRTDSAKRRERRGRTKVQNNPMAGAFAPVQAYYNPVHVQPLFYQPQVFFPNISLVNGYNPFLRSFSSQSFHSSNGNNFRRNERRSLTPKTNSEEVLLPDRTWENMGKYNSKSDFLFTVMSYNVLAQDLIHLHPYLYKRHDQRNLKWDWRWKNLLREIQNFQPDILCLQEVQGSHIEEYYSVLEKNLGYKGLYKQRTGARTDGCAIFFKTKYFKLIQFEYIEYFNQGIPLLNRDNVGIVAKLETLGPQKGALVVATTHLLYNPKRQDIRLAQTQVLLTGVDKMAFEKINESGQIQYLPTIITGDFNSQPSSVIYEFITSGSLKYENLTPRFMEKSNNGSRTGKILIPPTLKVTDQCVYEDVLNVRQLKNGQQKTQNNLENSKNYSTGTLTHNFPLKSVYSHFKNNEKVGSTYQDEWVTVDYIFYSGKKSKNEDEKLKLISRYTLPNKRELENVIIPNQKLGSDHLSLVARFKL